MKVTKLLKLKNNLYEVTVVDENNSQLLFKLSEDIIIEQNLYKNKSLTNDELKQLNSLVNYSKLYTSTLNYISYKMRTEFEVINYLKEKNCSLKIMEKIITKLKKLNYINDKIYCDAYVKQQFEANLKGIKVIRSELQKKKVNKSFVDKSIEYITNDMINLNIIKLIKHYDKVNKNRSIIKLKENILKCLLQKGYEYDLIIDNLNKYNFQENNDDEVLLKKQLQKAYLHYQKKYQGYELKTKVIKSLMNKGFSYEAIINVLTDLEG